MRNQFHQPLTQLVTALQQSSQRFASLSFAFSVAACGMLAPAALSAESTPEQLARAANPSVSATAVSQLPDGVYLYGQAQEPEQLGQGYFVFEVNQGDVVGALYMPRSSFDCAAGSFKDDQLALTVTNSYDRTTNPFEIALERVTNVASSAASGKPAIGLEGFYRIDQVSDNDLRILNVCKQDAQ
ncbi:hypothetical protein ACN4EK_25235 [Pantanalinema rosaneae CENA516]|uniref:hypothetical protein n=1 Tax=Pantanalinema rosaneae TaxID=1620701 RepID=UPI003D6E7896